MSHSLTLFETTPTALYTPQQSLFPPEIEDVTRFLHINHRLIEDMQGFVDIRRGGSANDMFVVLQNSELEKNQKDAGRIEGGEQTFFYRAGQLYGVTMAKDRYRRAFDADFVPDDPDAYVVAQKVVASSYQLFPYDQPKERWHQERSRERQNLGSQAFEYIDALLHAPIHKYYKQHSENERPADEETCDPARLAFYTGLVDAGIFCNTYMRFRSGLGKPAAFPESIEDQAVLMPYRDISLASLRGVLKNTFLPLPNNGTPFTDDIQADIGSPKKDDAWYMIVDENSRQHYVFANQEIRPSEAGVDRWVNNIKLAVPVEQGLDSGLIAQRILERMIAQNHIGAVGEGVNASEGILGIIIATSLDNKRVTEPLSELIAGLHRPAAPDAQSVA
jgi:hypothetical protein